ncbi:MAG: rhomboid family intramembrane serine protease, partial [Phycisphaerales bacterium JB065]
MLIPLVVDRPKKRPTVITYWLIAICVLVSLVQVILLRFNAPLHDDLFMSVEGTGRGILLLWPPGWEPHGYGFRFWQLFTSEFLHADMMHLLGNMLILFVFGPAVEDRFGRVWFLLFYLIGGVAASGVHMLAGGQQTSYGYLAMPSLGASGSISAVTGAFLVLFPQSGVRCFFIFFIGLFTIPAWWFIGFAIARDFLMSGLGDASIAYEAHIGGYLYGAAISVFLLWRKIIPREPYDLFSMGKQAHRRRQFRELTTKPLSDRVWDAPRGVPDGKSGVRPKRLSSHTEQEMTRRAAIHSAVEQQNLDEASRKYL